MNTLVDRLLDRIGDHSAYRTRSLPHPVMIELSPRELTREVQTGVAHLAADDGVDKRGNVLQAAGGGLLGTIYSLAPNSVEGAYALEQPAITRSGARPCGMNWCDVQHASGVTATYDSPLCLRHRRTAGAANGCERTMSQTRCRTGRSGGVIHRRC